MKFCKVLEGQDKDIPEFNHIVLRYKQLKKKIKAIPKDSGAPEDGVPQRHNVALPDAGSEGGPGPLSIEEQDFMDTLNEDVNRFNTFFMEKEEDAVINLQTMETELQQARDMDHLNEIRSKLVNFHGELVMILHWSLINYSAIVKILKKHDKRSGVLLRAPYLANVLMQPFSSTNVMSRLVKRAEELVASADQFPPKPVPAALAGGAPTALEPTDTCHEHADASSEDEWSTLTEVSGQAEPAIRRAKLALEMWQSLAKSASTPSTILHRLESTPVPQPGSSNNPSLGHTEAPQGTGARTAMQPPPSDRHHGGKAAGGAPDDSAAGKDGESGLKRASDASGQAACGPDSKRAALRISPE